MCCRHSDPSELEKYFFYGVGGGHMEEEEEGSEFSEGAASPTQGTASPAQGTLSPTPGDQEEEAATGLHKYFMAAFPQHGQQQEEEEDDTQHQAG